MTDRTANPREERTPVGQDEQWPPVVGLASTTHSPNELREADAELIIGDFTDRALYERLDR